MNGDAKAISGQGQSLRAAIGTVASWRTASLLYRVATARRATAGGAELSAVARLVGLVRDGASDPAAAQESAVSAGGIRLVGPHAIGADAWPTRFYAGHAVLLQHGVLRPASALFLIASAMAVRVPVGHPLLCWSASLWATLG